MKVLRKKVGEEPELIEIECSLEALHKEVDGYVEIFGSHVCSGNFAVNEDGIYLGLPYNCSVEGHKIYGTLIYMGPLAGDFTDAGQDAIKRYEAQANYGNLGKNRWIWA